MSLRVFSILGALSPFFFFAAASVAQSPDGAPSAPVRSIEDNLAIQLRSQPVSQGTAESLAMPDDFLDRVADRIIRLDYQRRFRRVLKDGDRAQTGTSLNPANQLQDRAAPESSSDRGPLIIAGAGLCVLIVGIAVLARKSRKGKQK